MRKIWQAIVVVVVGLGLGLATVGCESATTSSKDKMGGDKMGDKMGADKMGDKMGADKMKDDKMNKK